MMSTITFFSHYVPAVVRAMILHLLKLSPTSSVWGFKTAFLLSFVRAALEDPSPGSLLDAQQASLRQPDTNSTIHLLCLQVAVPLSNNIMDVVFHAIQRLGNGTETFPEFEVQSVSAEWVACRKSAVDPDGSQTSKYSALMQDVQNNTTILYFHGGQFW
jgi:hypothetical protein